MLKRKFLLLFVLFIFCFSALKAQEEARLLRFPAVYDNQVVFTYAGDMYTVDKDDGVARRLTSDPNGYEMFAHFSPDGKTIAFTAQYDGNTEVYIMPAEGGKPKRLTYTATLGRDQVSDRMGPNNIVMGWKDDDNIVFRSRMKSFNSFKGKLYTISVKGGLPQELPLPAAGFNTYSPDGSKLAFNRVFREFRTWKRYKGGMADNVWIYDFKSHKTTQVTDNVHQNIFPMWHGEKIYFISDRDQIMNLFVYDTNTKETKKLTNYTEFDIKFPTLGNKEIIYENGGYLICYDLATNTEHKVSVMIHDDIAAARMPLKDLSKSINSFDVSPNGERVVLNTRGDIFTVPAKEGITYELTSNSAYHDRNVNWSPNGKYISFVSDRTGENEIFIMNQDGSEKPVQITSNAKTYYYNPVWSPDSKYLMWSDKFGKLSIVNIESKKITNVFNSDAWEVYDYTWSPDSKWIAYTSPARLGSSIIYVYNLETKEAKPVTSSWYSSGDPCFDTNGKYLFFTSNRTFNPIYSQTEWNHAYVDMTKVYFTTLQKETPSPFSLKNDEVEVSKNKDDKKKKDDKKADDKSVKIDFDGIVDRIQVLPVAAASYWGITAIDNDIYFNSYSRKDSKMKLHYFNLKSKKDKDLGPYNYEVSANKKKMLVGSGNKFAVIDLPKGKIDPSSFKKASDIKAIIDLDKEYMQIFNESWRVFRDYFYAPNMHGVDWEKVREKYAPLVKYAKNRHDLNYVIGEMISEINVGHAYVSGGDIPKPKRINMGLLGAEISKSKSGYFKIDKILRGENWTKKALSPLTQPGIKVAEGDYIVAVNGKSTKGMDNIFTALIDKAGKTVELTVNEKASEKGSHSILIKPIADEAGLYYYNWVMENIEKVNKATDGKVGYIHIPDMGPEGLNEFVKLFYPQLNKNALIIDDRGNGGGNVSPMIIERLNRELSMITKPRNFKGQIKPFQMMTGPKVLLINNYSASDGDLFPYQFKELKIGKVIGIRSWGGVVGIRNSRPFVDGGDLRVPEFAPYDTKGKNWIIEGWGVEPDIVIDNDPYKEYIGEDQQLDKAIEVIKEELKNWKPLPEAPAFPDRSK
ncbi:MAG: S41 family peptidase [Hyphomicrobiales bacterium]